MAPVKHSAKDEDAFMANLLAGIDNSILDASPFPNPPTSRNRKLYSTPTKSKRATPYDRKPISSLSRTSSGESQKSSDADDSQAETLISNYDRADTTNQTLVDFDVSGLLDGAEDWDWDDMNDFLLPNKRSPKKVKAEPEDVVVTQTPPYVPPECTRCTVESVDMSPDQMQKILIVVTYIDNERRVVILNDLWVNTDVRKGDTVNIIGPFSSVYQGALPQALISSSQNLLILHPDTLLTATSIANTSQCIRKPILSSLVRSSSDVTPALVWGNLLHEVMQRCLQTQRWDKAFLDDCVENVLQRGMASLVRCDVSVEEARAELRRRAESVRLFGECFVGRFGAKPNEAAVLESTKTTKTTARLAITELHDIEEDIWSPVYGLKGKLDASIQATIEEHQEPTAPSFHGRAITPTSKPVPSSSLTTRTLPLEIKTGRAPTSLSGAGTEHRAQTMLYTMLMAERYGITCEEGLLYYLGGSGNSGNSESVGPGRVWRVGVGWNEVRGLVMARNEVVAWGARRDLKGWFGNSNRTKRGGGCENQELGGAQLEDDIEEPFLPPTIDDTRVCGRCYVADVCMLYRKTVESVEDISSPVSYLYAEKTAHLSSAHATFFRKWERLVSTEEEDIMKLRNEIWVVGSREREERGRCIGGLVLVESGGREDKDKSSKDGRIAQFVYRFVRKLGDVSGKARPILGGSILVGDPVTLSVDWEATEMASTPTSQLPHRGRFEYPRLIALARGYVLELTNEAVVVGLDHKVDDAYVRKRMGVNLVKSDPAFRLDKDDLTGGVARIRDNLAQMFYTGASKRRLELIVDLEKPEFDEELDKDVLSVLSESFQSSESESGPTLNTNQQQAVSHILRARDYALVLGMPGTGKTTTIAEVIRLLVSKGKTVLLTSYTHSAVDTILRKLVKGKGRERVEVLRVGNVDKVHPDIQPYTLGATERPTNMEQLEKQLLTPPVVATTCLSIEHELFSRRRFDYCIVDEASQITLPTCVGPLRFANRFVLVGDHFQLPPLVRSATARKAGLDVSLFRLLSNAHPQAVVDLAYQYRMNADIMLLSNTLIYGGRLKCGSEEVAERSLHIPHKKLAHDERECEAAANFSTCWLERLLHESSKAVFVNTDSIPASESREGNLPQNITEACLIAQFVRSLVRGGISQSEIGVISPYRQQIKALSRMLAEGGLCGDVEVLTADRSQGRDKEVVIVSMVRSNEGGYIGDLLRDWRRINVTFTRARSKLIIFGSRNTLRASPIMKEFFDLMDEKRWVLDLAKGADTWHYDRNATWGFTSTDTDIRLMKTGRKRITPEMVVKSENIDAPRAMKKPKTTDVTAETFMKNKAILRDIFNDAN